MLKCTPFILFDGQCAEAMTFYQTCLGGTLTMVTVGETPMKSQFPVEKHGRVINAQLKSQAIEISATDWLDPTQAWTQGKNVGLYVVGETYPEIRDLFDRLKAGASEQHFVGLMNMPFGTYGHFYDRFGISWFFKANQRMPAAKR